MFMPSNDSQASSCTNIYTHTHTHTFNTRTPHAQKYYTHPHNPHNTNTGLPSTAFPVNGGFREEGNKKHV